MTQVKRRKSAARGSAATNDRNFRTFLLVSQLEARAIGARIAQARRESGMTQEQVADVATFSKRSLQDYEAGTTIPYKHLRELSALLSRPVEWFLHGQPDAPARDEVLDRLAALEVQVLELARLVRRSMGGEAGESSQAPGL